jgi:hypothetical protein
MPCKKTTLPTLMQKARRAAKRGASPSIFTSNSKLTTSELLAKVERQSQQCRSANESKRVRRLVKKHKSSAPFLCDKIQQEDFAKIFLGSDDAFQSEFAEENDEFALVMKAVWCDQLKWMKLAEKGKSVRAMRYHPLTLRWALMR